MGSYGSPELHPKLANSNDTQPMGMKFFKFYTRGVLTFLTIWDAILFVLNVTYGNSGNIFMGVLSVPTIAAHVYSIFNLKKLTRTAYRINQYGLIYTGITNVFIYIMVFAANVAPEYNLTYLAMALFVAVYTVLVFIYFKRRKNMFTHTAKPIKNKSKQSGLADADEIARWKELLDAGAITQEEYDTKKSEILNQL